MTIKSKLLGSGLFLSLMIFILLMTSIYTFATLGDGFIEIIDKAKVGVSNSQATKTQLSKTSKELSHVSKDMNTIGDEINQTNMQMKLLERKIKSISISLKEFTEQAEEVTAEIPESDLLYDLQEMFDTLGDIEEILRREALIGLSRTAKKMVSFTESISKEVNSVNQLSAGLQKVTKLSTEVVKVNQDINSVSEKFNHQIKISRNLIVTLLIVVAIMALGFSTLLGFSIAKRMNIAVTALENIAQGDGDLTQRLDEKGKDEISHLAKAFNLFSSKIQGIMSQVTDITMAVKKEVNQVTLVNNSTSDAVKQQQQESDRVAESIREITTSIEMVVDNASNASSSAQHAKSQTNTGKMVVNSNRNAIKELADDIIDAQQIIKDLEENSHNIGTILDTIRGVAEQTNLLALNAAIEAARAGENGRGFAVVADEVRNLAQKTHQSTNEIQEMISTLQGMTEKSVVAMNNGRKGADVSVEQATNVGNTLDEISESISFISDLNSSVAESTEKQLASTVQIEKNIENMGAINQNSIEGVAQTETALSELSEQIMHLQLMVGQFKI